jgi:hypothetical protein
VKLILIALAILLAASATVHAQDSEFDVEGYQALEAQLEELDFARVATGPGSDERVGATIEAITHRRTLIHYISGWLRAGTVPDGAEESARVARLILVENIVQLSVEIGHCADAQDSMTLIVGFGSSGDPERQAAHQAAVEAVDACVDAEPQESTPIEEPELVDADPPRAEEVFVDVVQVPVEEPAPRASSGSRTGLALLGVGAAAVVAGATWNLSLLGDAGEYRDARDACESGESSECAGAERLRSDLADAKVPIAALVGGGVALATIGTVLHLRANGRRVDREVALIASPQLVGLQFRLRAGGAPR